MKILMQTVSLVTAVSCTSMAMIFITEQQDYGVAGLFLIVGTFNALISVAISNSK